MKLGAMSVSLNVKNIEQSLSFYQKLGFEVIAGELSQRWLIIRNGEHVIGLFQGMLDANMMTFNPGWDQQCNTLEDFTDVREMLASFEAQGINIAQKAIQGESGPSSFSVQDPDGNIILFDQHV